MPYRKNTQQCKEIFEDIIKTPHQTVKKHKEMWNHFEPRMKLPLPTFHPPWYGWHHARSSFPARKHVHKVPLHNFGILDSKNAPPVTIIDVKPRVVSDYENRKPLVILPVYLRTDNNHGSLNKWHNDNTLRSANPFALHKQIAESHNRTDIANSTKS